jgi:hypothetical protein
MKTDKIELLYKPNTNYNIPLFLECTSDEMGVMVGFDGEIEQVEQLVNFSFSGITGTRQVIVYSTTNPDKFKKIVEQEYTINWGDGNTSGLTVNSGVIGSNFPSLAHTYATNGEYNITMSLDTPWTKEKITKKIKTPFTNPSIIPNELGTFTTVAIPAYSNMTGQSINYINDLDFTNTTGDTTFRYIGIGNSRILELKKYGENVYTGVSTGTDNNGNYSGYTFTYTNNSNTMIITYRDYEDGYTLITGSTVGFTKEEVFNTMITREEHFLGFIDEPTVYSDVFVERGKQGVMEKNHRLGEIDSIGEIEIYGNGYFNIRKQ